MKNPYLLSMLLAFAAQSTLAATTTQAVTTVSCPARVKVNSVTMNEEAPHGFDAETRLGSLALFTANIYAGSVDLAAVVKPSSDRFTKKGTVSHYDLDAPLNDKFLPFNVVCEYGEGVLFLVRPLPDTVKQCTYTSTKSPRKVLFQCSP